ncbi:histidine kinase [Pseudofrankia sp. BMG5.36]|uniref:histidine kinase n=1 Tax=Pseudofrankia sp. BMG5.36 TaxID=1834512 RepID=UPI0012FF621E|nr:histidine kinase [Pseudofrankia sp. BMG5.36]
MTEEGPSPRRAHDQVPERASARAAVAPLGAGGPVTPGRAGPTAWSWPSRSRRADSSSRLDSLGGTGSSSGPGSSSPAGSPPGLGSTVLAGSSSRVGSPSALGSSAALGSSSRRGSSLVPGWSWRTWVSWLLAAGSVGVTAVALVVAVRDGLTWGRFVSGDPGFSVVLAVMLPLLGTAILYREPGNRLAWIFAVAGVSRAVFVAAIVWADHVYVTGPGTGTGGPVASWLTLWSRLPAPVLAPLILLWFPDGRPPPGRRWRAAQLTAAVGGAAVVVVAVLSWPFRGPRTLPDAPTPPGVLPAIVVGALGVVIVAALAGLAAGLASLVSRLRHAEPVTRQQVKWQLFGGVAGVVLNLAGDLVTPRVGLNLAGTLAVVAAMLLAIERYQLWSIDRLINRTLVYGTLTVLAAATYAGCAAGFGMLTAGLAHGRSVAIVGATLAAAALVSPARRTVQATIDRWFDRRRFDAVARVRAYADRLGTAPAAPGELRGVLAAALRDPELALLFTLADGRLVDAAGAPAALPIDAAGPTSTAGPDEVATGGARSGIRAVRRLGSRIGVGGDGSGRAADDTDSGGGGGGELGVLVHRPLPPHEWDLLDAVLAAAAMPLEYARLQAELRVQLAAVEASRGRIVAAADAERRRIERNLHDGAQQRLVALALRLRSEQRRLGGALDPATLPLLDLAVDELRAAVDDLRTLAAGLLPAALASEGLGPALRELVDRAPADVRLLDLPAHRHGPSTEATGWFVVAEGLANAAKHAAGAWVTVSASCRESSLTVTVVDGGPGGAVIASDAPGALAASASAPVAAHPAAGAGAGPAAGSGLRGLADRVEACGGQLVVASPLGGPTELRAELPCG